MSRKKAPIADDDSPEWTEAMFAKATKFPAGTKLTDAAAQMMKRRGRPKLEAPKKSITLRVDADVIDAYRKLGDGWQTAINTDLRKARKLKAG
jgi:uncharacterized protein (DUF4415 family)